jgi:hypothetical protein
LFAVALSLNTPHFLENDVPVTSQDHLNAHL